MTRSPLCVLVTGVSPANKGATLMLRAIQSELGRRLPGTRVAMPAIPLASAPVTGPDRAELGLWTALPESWHAGRGKGRLRGAAWDLLGSLTNVLPVVRADEVDAVLDASGFAYGDFWGRSKFETRLGSQVAGWKAMGRTVICLPQAWGPFEADGFAPAVRAGLAQADLVFARDPESLAHLEAAGVTARPAPDFTNLLAPGLPGDLERLRGSALLIPNSKILEARGDASRGAYLDFLGRAATVLEGLGTARLLVHEGAGDLALAQEVNAAREAAGHAPLEIVDPGDPLVVKAVIGAASALISSRFHGLVSALSAGVPAMACGWSHKYGALLKDYGMGAHQIDLDAPDGWQAALDGFAAATRDPATRPALSEAAAREKARARTAWDAIEAVLTGKGAPS